MPTCICGYTTASTASLRAHRLTCSGRGYKCPKCPNELFQTRAAYEAHVKTHTSRPKVPPTPKVKESSPYKLLLIAGKRVWQRQREPGTDKSGLSPLAEP